MRGSRILSICLVTGLALGALTAPCALAEAPEFGRCVKGTPKEGGYITGTCVATDKEDNDGAYEWKPGPGPTNKFAISGGKLAVETVSHKLLICSAETGSGEYSNTVFNRLEGITLVLTGCQASFKCATTGKPPGELELTELQGEVSWENKLKKKTALVLEPPPGSGGLFTKFSCMGLGIEWKAHGPGILVAIKNDKMTATETLKYSARSGKQKPLKWRAGEASEEEAFLEESFEESPFEQAGFAIETTIKNKEPIELNAVV
jgi:hypothetical protein